MHIREQYRLVDGAALQFEGWSKNAKRLRRSNPYRKDCARNIYKEVVNGDPAIAVVDPALFAAYALRAMHYEHARQFPWLDAWTSGACDLYIS